MAETKMMKIKVLRAFRISGLDESTKGLKNGVIGVGSVIEVKASFGRMMISQKKAEETSDAVKTVEAPAGGAPKPNTTKKEG
jgi:hypothetical protein